MHVAKIIKPYYDWNGRKYMLLQIDEVLYQVKVPYRYNRVMCNVCGLKPIQEYTKDEIVFLYGGDACNDLSYNNVYSQHINYHKDFGVCFVRELITNDPAKS